MKDILTKKDLGSRNGRIDFRLEEVIVKRLDLFIYIFVLAAVALALTLFVIV